jgi:hypothetical protein
MQKCDPCRRTRTGCRGVESGDKPGIIPADAVAEELLGLLALADEAARLHLLRVAAGLNHPARADARPLLAAASAGQVRDAAYPEPAAAVALAVVVPTPTHGCEAVVVRNLRWGQGLVWGI